MTYQSYKLVLQINIMQSDKQIHEDILGQIPHRRGLDSKQESNRTVGMPLWGDAKRTESNAETEHVQITQGRKEIDVFEK